MTPRFGSNFMACRSSQPLTKKKSKTIEMISLIVNKPAVCIDMRIVVMMSLNGDWGQQHDSQDQLQKIYDDLIKIYCKIANSTLLSLGRYRSTWNLFISTHKNIQLVARVIASHLSINFLSSARNLSRETMTIFLWWLWSHYDGLPSHSTDTSARAGSSASRMLFFADSEHVFNIKITTMIDE